MMIIAELWTAALAAKIKTIFDLIFEKKNKKDKLTNEAQKSAFNHFFNNKQSCEMSPNSFIHEKEWGYLTEQKANSPRQKERK